MPPGNKAQIFNSSGSDFFCLIDPATATTINASSTGAFNSIKELCDNPNDEDEGPDFLDLIPSKNSFVIGTNYEKEFLPECRDGYWTKLRKDSGHAQILYDFVGYLIFIEDYAGCRLCLEKLNKIDNSVLEAVTDKNTILGM